RALHSPFAGDVELHMAAVFNDSAQRGPGVDALVHVDLTQVTLSDSGDGIRRGSLGLAAIALAQDETIVSDTERVDLAFPPDLYQQALRNGYLYTIHVPVKKAGVYQVRTAVRDAATGKIGSANQSLTVPDTTKGELALSSIVIGGEALSGNPEAVGGLVPKYPKETLPIRI